jgi:hypothetical protein
MPKRPRSKTTAEDVQVGLAGVAAAGADLTQLQRPAEEAARLLVQGARPFEALPLEDEGLPRPRRQAVLLRVADRPFGTGLDAVRAEEAAAQVEARAAFRDADGAGRAGVGAGAAAVGAFGGVHDRQAAEAVGQGRLLRRIGAGAVALVQAGQGYLEHGSSSLVIEGEERRPKPRNTRNHTKKARKKTEDRPGARALVVLGSLVSSFRAFFV